MRRFIIIVMCVAAIVSAEAAILNVNLSDYGFKPNKGMNRSDHLSQCFQQALDNALKLRQNEADTLVLQFAKGDYYFASEKPHHTAFFISNHDHAPIRFVGLSLDSISNIVVDGSGSTLFFEAPAALPIAIIHTHGCTISNLSIDYPKPHIIQGIVEANDTLAGEITLLLPDYVNTLLKKGKLSMMVDGTDVTPWACIAFEEGTGRVVYRTSDIGVSLENPKIIDRHKVRVQWQNPALIPGTRLAMRTYARPCPTVFVDESSDISLNNVNIHYAEGMGVLAQNSADITLSGVSVKRSERYPERMHTTQADATHFSGCRGTIKSVDGFYEGMMDDAINIHGTYLKITEISSDRRSVTGAFMHNQSFGFGWGEAGDSIVLVKSKVMDYLPETLVAEKIEPLRDADGVTRGYRLSLNAPLSSEIDINSSDYGLENISATPVVYFARNTVRNNRARGALFSSPRRTVVEHNTFDHTSGTAILLCGDCNGWYESGACRDILIRNNRFINALTSLYQFTNAVISIYPEIPDLTNQQGYFHSGIEIVDNYFYTFDLPILYAKSVNGLRFEGNLIERNNDHKPFHPNRTEIRLERVTDASIN